ncbi:MAG: gamma-glutamyl kinase [Paracoccaceae bacterium]
MLVFWKQSLVFLAVPKTGTTAIEGALAPRATLVVRDPPHLKHSPVYRYHRHVRPFLATAGEREWDLTAMVRHPVDWLASWWRYRARDDLAGHPNSTRGMGFDDFVDAYCRGKPPSFANVGSQARFVAAPEGTPGIAHLYRYEAQEAFLSFLSERLDGPVEPGRKNVSPAREEAVLSTRMRTKFETKRAAEFEVWEGAKTR